MGGEPGHHGVVFQWFSTLLLCKQHPKHVHTGSHSSDADQSTELWLKWLVWCPVGVVMLHSGLRGSLVPVVGIAAMLGVSTVQGAKAYCCT